MVSKQHPLNGLAASRARAPLSPDLLSAGYAQIPARRLHSYETGERAADGDTNEKIPAVVKDRGAGVRGCGRQSQPVSTGGKEAVI
jgi:hypothetical protein